MKGAFATYFGQLRQLFYNLLETLQITLCQPALFYSMLCYSALLSSMLVTLHHPTRRYYSIVLYCTFHNATESIHVEVLKNSTLDYTMLPCFVLHYAGLLFSALLCSTLCYVTDHNGCQLICGVLAVKKSLCNENDPYIIVTGTGDLDVI